MPKSRVVYLNSWHRAMAGVMKLRGEDVERQIRIITMSIDALLKAGDQAEEAWESLADSVNVAESLSSIGIGRGADADIILRQAQEALAYVRQERIERNTWALRAEDRVEVRLRLELLRDLHKVQLGTCSYAEFERAFRKTQERVKQARAGNAPADAVVVHGQIK